MNELIPVIKDDSVCRVKVTHDSKHLLGASASDASANCGTVTHPWILESPKGQQVQVIYVSVGKSSGVNTVCSFSQGSIIDKPGKRNVSICDRGMKSGPSVEIEMNYLSEGNLLEIYLHQRVDHSFVLKIKGEVLAGFELTGLGFGEFNPPVSLFSPLWPSTPNPPTP